MGIRKLNSRFLKVVLILGLLVSPRISADDYHYESPSRDFVLRFPSEPHSLRVHGPKALDRVGDGNGFSIAVYPIPGGAEDEFLGKLLSQNEDGWGNKIEHHWVKIDGHSALRRVRYPNAKVLPLAEPSDKYRLLEQVFLVNNGKVYDFLVDIDGENKKAMEERAYSFWSSFKFK